MLYKLNLGENENNALRPVKFQSFADLNLYEKNLENIIVDNLFDTIYEESRLMPFYREKQGQSVADIYALNAEGDVIIFELKRAKVQKDTINQIFKYAHKTDQWSYQKLNKHWQEFREDMPLFDKIFPNPELSISHQQAFDLNVELDPVQFNKNQKLYIIGYASDDELRKVIRYWSKQGVDINFLPYRIYEFDSQKYFEIFAPPYDHHQNPSELKGVLFDTRKNVDKESVWDMLEKERVSGFYNAATAVNKLNKGDKVFYYHAGVGIIAAAQVITDVKKQNEESFCQVEFLTKKPTRDNNLENAPALTPTEIKSITGESFYWASTIKKPALNTEQSDKLLQALKDKIDG